MPSQKPDSPAEYLAALDERQRPALEKLRKMIQAAVPKAEECMSYGLPAFRLAGKPLVAYGASAKHCAFYLMSGSIVEAHPDDLKKYDTSKGTIRFTPDEPLPGTLVKKLVKARIAENEQLARSPKSSGGKNDPAVTAFMKALDHPLKKAVEAVRQIILDVSPEVQEGIKWNSPSFRTTEYFATLNLHRGRIRLVLHLGAKVKPTAKTGIEIGDPSGLLEWLAEDRATIVFEDGKDVEAKREALKAILLQWIKRV